MKGRNVSAELRTAINELKDLKIKNAAIEHRAFIDRLNSNLQPSFNTDLLNRISEYGNNIDLFNYYLAYDKLRSHPKTITVGNIRDQYYIISESLEHLIRTPEEQQLAAQVLNAIYDALNDPSSQNINTLKWLTDRVDGHPSFWWKRIRNAMGAIGIALVGTAIWMAAGAVTPAIILPLGLSACAGMGALIFQKAHEDRRAGFSKQLMTMTEVIVREESKKQAGEKSHINRRHAQ